MDTREAFVKKTEADLEYGRAWLKKAQADAQLQGTRTYEEIRQKVQDMSHRLEGLKARGDDAWQEMREALEQARKDLEAGLKAAREKVGV